jgi:hypothetical protein
MGRVSARSLVLTACVSGCLASEDPSSSNGEPLTRSKVSPRPDPTGTIASFSSNRFDTGTTDAFFTALGPNGRSCGTCHVQEQAWSISAAAVQALALAEPQDPLFAPVDGSDCPPTAPNAVPDAAASTLLTGYGLIRIQIAIPAGAEFDLDYATNPSDCAIAPGGAAIGGRLFLFRRPLPTASLLTLSTVMWDGRETLHASTTSAGLTQTDPLVADLAHQDDDAALGHEQTTQSLAGSQALADALDFETNLFSAQLEIGALRLDKHGGHGGPEYLGEVAAQRFFIGENDPLGNDFDPRVFALYAAWEPGGEHRKLTETEEAIGRGERLFNERTFTIANVAGLNSAHGDPLANPADPLFDTPFSGTCTVCHNAFDIGNHSSSLPVNIGVTSAAPTDNHGRSVAGSLDTASLPVYHLRRAADGTTVDVTDPARGLISKRWVDIGKTKGPILRGLAGRAPYFHNGSARDLYTVVDFYDARFEIGLSERDKGDLVAFLAAL